MSEKIALIWKAHIPENQNTTRYQRATYLCENYDCEIFTTSTDVADHISEKAPTTTKNRENAISGLVVLLLAIYRICLSNRDEYVAVHTSYHPAAAVIGFICKMFGLIWIHDVWDHPALGLSDPLNRQRNNKYKYKFRRGFDVIVYKISSQLISKADCIILGMHGRASDMLNLPSGRVDSIPNGIDLQIVGGNNLSRTDSLTVLYIGAVIPVRGIDTLLRSIDSVSKSINDLSLELVGEVPDRAWLNKEIKSRGLSDTVEVTGEVSHQEALQRIANADVGVCPFPRKKELEYIYPIKLFEYMALGAVPVCSNLTGIADVIEHEKNGFLFEPSDSDELEDIIMDLRMNESKRDQVAHTALNSVQKYDWNEINKEFGLVLDRALSE